MTMNTDFVFQCWLKKDMPQNVVDILRYMVSSPTATQPPAETARIAASESHPLFTTNRWEELFGWGGGKPGEPYTAFEELDWAYGFAARTDFPNYDNEIEYFLDWITPYIDPEGYEDSIKFMGYTKFEESLHPTLIYYEDDHFVMRSVDTASSTPLSAIIATFAPRSTGHSS